MSRDLTITEVEPLDRPGCANCRHLEALPPERAGARIACMPANPAGWCIHPTNRETTRRPVSARSWCDRHEPRAPAPTWREA